MIIHHFPRSVEQAFKLKYEKIEWEHNKNHFNAWCEGKTGYPLVDAGMRELNTTGVPAEVSAEFDVRTDKPLLRISRRHHGNIKSSVITQDFVHGADYGALAEAANTFRGLLGEGAKVMRGEGERHLVPADVDVGMVPGFLGKPGHGVDEPDGRREVLELVGTRDDLRLPSPQRHGWERGLDLKFSSASCDFLSAVIKS